MAGDARTTTTIEELIASGSIIAHKDGNYGSNYPRVEEFGSEGVPFLTAKSLRDGYVDIAGAPRLGDARADELRFGFVESDDVLLSHNATIGRVAVVPQHKGRLLVGTSLTYFRLNPQKLLPRYFAVYLAGSDFQNQLVAVMSHSTRNQVPVTAQRKLNVVVPPLVEQKAIAQILGTLDDKIELNRRMNATLEAIAKALFQSWFVDFEPVRAKLDGRKPIGLDEATAAIFPESFQDSALGSIPFGWTIGTLGKIGANPRRGLQPEAIAPNTPYIALEHLPRRSIALTEWDEAANVASGKFSFNKGEILFGKLRPYFHKVGIAPVNGVCSTDILVLAPRKPEWFGFLLGHATSDELIQFTDLASTGTKMPRTNWNDISSFKTVLPPESVAAVFTRLIEPLIDQIVANIYQCRSLTSLRDALLPKLLSGELRVRHANGF